MRDKKRGMKKELYYEKDTMCFMCSVTSWMW